VFSSERIDQGRRMLLYASILGAQRNGEHELKPCWFAIRGEAVEQGLALSHALIVIAHIRADEVRCGRRGGARCEREQAFVLEGVVDQLGRLVAIGVGDALFAREFADGAALHLS
jgi:hypothetical protein